VKRALIGGLVALALAIPGTASAAPDEVRETGKCSIKSDWELRVKDEGRTLRVRWRVNSRIQDQTWQLALAHNGTQIATAKRVLSGEGEATLEKRGIPDRPGADTFTGTAESYPSGETCAGEATL
jgi:cation diffusion facilitator CzcD-associated flavoprotein CzcO